MKFKLTWIDLILIVILSFSVYLIAGTIDSEIEAQRIEAENFGTTLAAELQLAIDDQFIVMDSVESLVKIECNNANFGQVFDLFVAPLFEKNKSIKNISVAPNGVQAYVYPLEGNEVVIGHDLINDERENVRRDVNRTITTRSTAVSGPYELRQGGLGLIARKAIYRDDEFWGLVAMVADFDVILERLSINNINTSLAIQLIGPTGDLILSNRPLIGEVLSSKFITLPEGEIELLIGESELSNSDLSFVYYQWGLIIIVLIALAITVFRQNRKYLKSLQKELNDRIIQVNILSNELEKGKMMAIGSLVRGLCHEVNTPLGSSLTLMSFAERELDKSKLCGEEVSESVSAAISNINKSIGIIDKLRDITEIQSAHKILEFNIKEYLEFAVYNSRLSTTEKNVNVDINCSDQFRVINNPSAFYQVINLLIENSIVHGFNDREEGNIKITIQMNHSAYEIIYEDNGIGVEEEKLHNLFEPYYTSDMSKFRGLGLYTVFTLINNHIKGDIHVESVVGNYTRFIIHMPQLNKVENSGYEEYE